MDTIEAIIEAKARVDVIRKSFFNFLRQSPTPEASECRAYFAAEDAAAEDLWYALEEARCEARS